MKLRFQNNRLFSALLGGIAAILLCGNIQAYAQTVTQVTPLYFGRFAIVDTSLVSQITVDPDGSVTTNANTAVIDEASPGEYTISGPANRPYSVTLPSSITLSGPQGTMTIDNFSISPVVLITDGAGEDDITIGARLRTIGMAPGLPDGAYNGTLTITVNF